MADGFATTAIVRARPTTATDQPSRVTPAFATTSAIRTEPTRATATPVKVLPAFAIRFYQRPSEAAVSGGAESFATVAPHATQYFATLKHLTCGTKAVPNTTTTGARSLTTTAIRTTTSMTVLRATPLPADVTPIEVRPYGLTAFSETASTGQKLGHATPYVSNTSAGEATHTTGTLWRLTSYSGYSADEAVPGSSTEAPRTAFTSPKTPWSAEPSHATLATGRKLPWFASGIPGEHANAADRALATETPRTAETNIAAPLSTTLYGASTTGTKPRFATAGTRATAGTHYAAAHGLKLAEATEKVGYNAGKGEAAGATGLHLAEANTTTTYTTTAGESTLTAPLPAGLVTEPNIPPSATCIHKDTATLLGGTMQIRPGIVGPYGFLFATEAKPPTPALTTPSHAAFATHARYEIKETVYACAQYPMNERLRAALMHRMSVRSVQALIETEDGTATVIWKDGVARVYGPAEARDRIKKLLQALAELDATQDLQS